MTGQTSDHEFMINDGKVWAHGLQDCIVSALKPTVKFWGEYLCGSERKKDIAKHRKDNYMWEVTSFDFIAAFGSQKGKQVEEYKDY